MAVLGILKLHPAENSLETSRDGNSTCGKAAHGQEGGVPGGDMLVGTLLSALALPTPQSLAAALGLAPSLGKGITSLLAKRLTSSLG